MPLAIYDPVLNLVRTYVRDDKPCLPPAGLECRDPATLPAEARYEPLQRFSPAEQIQQIKEQARADILERYPEWRQANMTARAVELLELQAAGKPWSEAEAAEALQIREAWTWIKERRSQSDAEEAAVLDA